MAELIDTFRMTLFVLFDFTFSLQEDFEPHERSNQIKILSYFSFHFFTFKEELEPHERCIRKILEQKGRVVEIVYRLENSTEDIVEGFQEFEDDVDEVGFDVASDEGSRFFEDEDEGLKSVLRQSVRSVWVRIQLGMKIFEICQTANDD